ncbi:MAG: sel1 repeat family protein, partial [Bacteroidaceae bacterium]|nr:sel1 repeat family protein [Bacteroidaceae bacterium]
KTSYSHNMYTYMLLGSELKGYIPDAAQYFDPDNANRHKQLDLVMLTHGWTSYDWSMLARPVIEDIQPIERGITIKGKFFQKTKNKEIGSYGKAKVVPQKNTLTRFDISTDGSQVQTSTFRTDSTGSFVLETDDFYGTRVASLRPQTALRQTGNIAYQFALDRYYSPGFRLYDYWENHLGKPMSKSQSDSLVKLNPFEYMLSSVEVVAKKKDEINSRPPHSEMRFNYLDEWEYAQDVTYLDVFNTYEDEVYDYVKSENYTLETFLKELHDSELTSYEKYLRLKERGLISQDIHLVFNKNYDDKSDILLSKMLSRLNDAYYVDNDRNEDIVSRIRYSESGNNERYIGNIRYGEESMMSIDPHESEDVLAANELVVAIPVNHDYNHILTANDVVLSAMRRHNYNWAYWVQLMVVLGDYNHKKTPVPDMEYLRGLPDAEKMTNFKEFVIRSDENTRSQFENRITHWTPLTRMLDNKVPIQKFYRGFLSQSYLYSSDGIDGCPGADIFWECLNNAQNGGVNYPMNPNYVACLIPYSEEERTQGVVPEFAAPGSTMRYTSVQGYSESKQFYSPDYGAMTPQEKDYRRTLYWNPTVKIENGEAVMEFYNSSYCTGIIVDVAGRDNDIMFSNDAVTRTRFAERAVEKKSLEKESTAQEVTSMDSATLAACAYHHERAMIYYNQKRYKDALTMFIELAQHRYAPSMYYVGLCYLNGTGLKKNDEQAYKFISNAAECGEPGAMYDLAVLTTEGIGTDKNEALAHKYFESAATLDEPRALVEMAHRYIDGTMVEQDKDMAERSLKRAAELRYPQAQLEYGWLLTAGGRDGTVHIRAAAEAKYPEALLFMYEHEDKAGNYKDAYKYAKELHILGDHRGTKLIADCYHEGKGVKRDKRLAKDLYREAAAAGNEEAKKILE